MAEYIEREAFLDAIERGKKYQQDADDIAEMLQNFPAADVRPVKWIPVTERLPEDGQWVLVWGHGQKIPIMMFHESGAWIDDQFEFHATIPHWMPLPEPPKEE